MEVECRDCAAVVPPAAKPGTEAAVPGLGIASPAGRSEPAPASRAPGLSEEVALALERVLGRNTAEKDGGAVPGVAVVAAVAEGSLAAPR